MNKLVLTNRAMANIGRHGLNVYPLEGYGLLVGDDQSTRETEHVIAVLPVGKTRHWYEDTGRFAGIAQACAIAAKLFAHGPLHVAGMYCSCSGFAHIQRIGDSAPRMGTLRWLLIRPVVGGETIYQSHAMYLLNNRWEKQTLKTRHEKVEAPDYNPKRIAKMWNRTWGVLDYGNKHETGLPRFQSTS